jgi:hypothetical protein
MELPSGRGMRRGERLHQPHQPDSPAVIDAAGAWPVGIDSAAVLAKMDAGAVVALFEKIAVTVVRDFEPRKIFRPLLAGIDTDALMPAALAAAIPRDLRGKVETSGLLMQLNARQSQQVGEETAGGAHIADDNTAIVKLLVLSPALGLAHQTALAPLPRKPVALTEFDDDCSLAGNRISSAQHIRQPAQTQPKPLGDLPAGPLPTIDDGA